MTTSRDRRLKIMIRVSSSRQRACKGAYLSPPIKRALGCSLDRLRRPISTAGKEMPGTRKGRKAYNESGQ